MRRIIFISFFFMSVGAWAAKDISVELVVDEPSVSVGEEISLQISVHGVRSADPPILLNDHGFSFQITGTSSQMSIVNMTATSTASFSASLNPTTAGDFQIGPAQVTVDGKQYQSNSVRIHVGRGTDAGANSPAADFKIESFVANKSPYVYQQVLYTFRFLAKGNLGDARLQLPDFKGFFKESLGNERRYQKVIDGQNWRITEVQYALFPTASGQLTLAPATLEAEVEVETPANKARRRFDPFFNDSFFGVRRGQMKRLRLQSEPTTINVLALPANGKPADFSGLVGRFRASASLSKSQVAVGESATLSLTVEGEGNVRDANLPDVKWPDFKTYDDEPVVKMTSDNEQISGLKTFKKALVPLSEGSKTIAPVAIAYFDPFEKAYKAATTAPLNLTVTPGTGADLAHQSASGGTGLEKKDVKVQGEDLMPPKRMASLHSDSLTSGETRIGWFFFGLGPVGFLFAFFYHRRLQRIRADAGYHRRSKAYKSFASRLTLNREALTYDELSTALRKYLGDKLTFDGTALTPIEAEKKLEPFKLAASSVSEVKSFLSECERGSYGGGSLTSAKQTELYQRLNALVEKLEKEISS